MSVATLNAAPKPVGSSSCRSRRYDDAPSRDEKDLARAFPDAGVDIDQTVVTTCGGGVTAAVLLFALDRLGKSDIALYDGSWSEWGADPGTPKETGPAD